MDWCGLVCWFCCDILFDSFCGVGLRFMFVVLFFVWFGVCCLGWYLFVLLFVLFCC